MRAGIPNTFGIPMVVLCSVFQWRSVSQKHSALNKMAKFVFPMVEF